jgi:hypothetical protein
VRRRVLTLPIVLAVLALAVSPGCKLIDTDTPTEKAVAVLNDSIGKVQAESANWRDVLDDTADRLPEEIRQTIRNDLQNLADRTLAATRENVQCLVDFAGQRVKQGLERIKAKLLGVEVSIEPFVCIASPPYVDMNLPPTARNVIELSGFDLDSQPPIQVYHATSDGVIEVTDKFTEASKHYRRILNLASQGGVQLGDRSQRIIFRWKDRELSSVAVLAKEPPRCPPSAEVVHASSPVTYRPPHTGVGDREVFGKVDLWAKATLLVTPQSIDVRVDATAKQWDDDRSEASGSAIVPFFDAVPKGWEIDHVQLGSLEASASFRDTTWEPETTSGGGGLVNSWVWYGDHNGADLETYSGVDVHFNPVTIVFKPTADCVPSNR